MLHPREIVFLGPYLGRRRRGEFLSDWNDWSEREDSNLRPLAPEASALPGCATLRPTVSPNLGFPAATLSAKETGVIATRITYRKRLSAPNSEVPHATTAMRRNSVCWAVVACDDRWVEPHQ
jgi:hypothetical protein